VNAAQKKACAAAPFLDQLHLGRTQRLRLAHALPIYGWALEVVRHPAKAVGWVLLERRWVEWTFGWLGRNRRMSKDYERLSAVSETRIHIAMIKLMVLRLKPA
jgi:transposase